MYVCNITACKYINHTAYQYTAYHCEQYCSFTPDFPLELETVLGKSLLKDHHLGETLCFLLMTGENLILR